MKEGKYEKRVQMKYQDQNKIEIDVIFTLANLFTNELLRKDLEIHLDTLANPGWFFTINLNSIVSCNSNDYIVLKSIKKSDSDWIELFTKNKELRFAASTFNLIKSFRLLFEYIEKYIGSDFIIYGENEILNKVVDWYSSSQNEDWEEYGGIHMDINCKRCRLRIKYYDLIYNFKNFKNCEKIKSDNDYYKYSLENYSSIGDVKDEKMFIGYSSLNNISKLFEGFLYNLTFLEDTNGINL